LAKIGVLVSDSSRAPLRLVFPAALASRWMPGLFPEGTDSVTRRELNFVKGNERFVFDRDAVVFWGMDGETRVRCEISREALDDHFGGDGKDKLEVFKANRRAIEDITRRKYLAGETEPDGSVLIRTSEV
jgi:hypothetical protein